MDMNPQAAAPAAQDPAAAMAQEQQPAAPSGFTVCIHCDAEGKLSVGVEQDAAPTEAGEPAAYTPAADRKEALTMALDLLKSEGKANPGDALGKRLATAGFSAGYNED